MNPEGIRAHRAGGAAGPAGTRKKETVEEQPSRAREATRLGKSAKRMWRDRMQAPLRARLRGERPRAPAGPGYFFMAATKFCTAACKAPIDRVNTPLK
jgi:hypothetical protein